jgi:hypothetical protein
MQYKKSLWYTNVAQTQPKVAQKLMISFKLNLYVLNNVYYMQKTIVIQYVNLNRIK